MTLNQLDRETRYPCVAGVDAGSTRPGMLFATETVLGEQGGWDITFADGERTSARIWRTIVLDDGRQVDAVLKINRRGGSRTYRALWGG